MGSSGGLIIIWCSSQFSSMLIHKLLFALTVKMTYVQTNQSLFLTDICGPCDGTKRLQFTQWLEELHIDIEDLWLFMGEGVLD